MHGDIGKNKTILVCDFFVEDGHTMHKWDVGVPLHYQDEKGRYYLILVRFICLLYNIFFLGFVSILSLKTISKYL